MSTVDLAKESLPDGFRAGNGTVGTTPAALSSPSRVRKRIVVRADKDNSGTIRVGPRGNVAFTLNAGDFVEIAIDDVSKVYIVADADTQAYSWMSI